MHPV
jgi:hypothetical protein